MSDRHEPTTTPIGLPDLRPAEDAGNAMALIRLLAQIAARQTAIARTQKAA